MVSDYSFTSGISAMKAHTRAFAAISDNISHINTAGFKHTEVSTVASTRDANRGSVYGNFSGAYSRVQGRFGNEGTTVATQNPLDAALIGKGYFVTSDSLTGGSPLLTAAGQFRTTLDPAGSGSSYITDQSGNYLMGWAYDPNTETFASGTDFSSLSPIRADRLGNPYAAVATTEARISGNLNSDTAVGEGTTISFGVLDGSGDADGINDAQNFNLVFAKSATPNTWDVTVTGDNGTVSPNTFQISFDEQGRNPTVVGSGATTISLNGTWANSGASNTVSVDLSGFNQFAGPNTLDSITTNGFTEGVLQSTYFGSDGILYGNFTNGNTRPVAKLAIGDVINPEGMEAISGTSFRLTPQSGTLSLYDPTTSVRATVVAGAYEAPSTNINSEFSKMIVTQRAYSSAATTIRTADEMIQTAGDMK